MTILSFICLHAFWPNGYQRRNQAKNYKKDDYLKQVMQKDVLPQLKLPQSVMRMSLKSLEKVQQNNAIDVLNFVLLYVMFRYCFSSLLYPFLLW